MNIVLTNAGLQKIVNAEQTGTAPVVISQIAFGSGQYTANASQIALQNEIKRLPVISGGTDSSHSIHVAAQDTSSDAYSVYEFGLFLSDGTLFAVYSQTGTPILQKTISSVAQFECGIALQGVNIESISFGDVSFSYPYATETNAGIAEIATTAEAQDGTDKTRFVTPFTLQQVTATDSRKGVVELATAAEAQAGTDSNRALTPAALQAVTATDSRKGVVELATAAEAQAGTDSSRALTPAALQAVTATDSRKGVVELATAAEAQAGTDSSRALTPATLQQVTATQTRKGVIEIATNTEAQTGTDTEKAITPAALQAVTATESRKGVVALATTAEAQAGTNASKAVTPAGVSAAIANTAATDSKKGVVELATAAEAQAGTDATRVLTPATLQQVTATDSRKGVVELATNSETQTGSDATRAVTPAGLKSLTATTGRRGLIAVATNDESVQGTNNSDAVPPTGLKAALDDRFNGVVIDEEGRVNNLMGYEPWSIFPSGRSVEMTARAGVCQKTLARFSANTAAAVFNFFKSRSSTIRKNGAVQPGDTVGQVDFIADNGKMDYNAGTQGARVGLIQVEVHDDSTIPAAGNTNTAIKGIVRIYAMEDGTDTVGRGINVVNDAVYPSNNNALTSGSSTHRWKAVYAVNGTIQTSDENMKEEIGEIPEAVFKAWEKVKFVQYKFKDAVKEKGEKARFHIGLIAQRIVEAFEAEGLDAFSYGLVCRDALKDGGEILSLRYDECLALECAYERNRFDKILIKLKGGDC
jgi:hypothetical protein